jgi:hypothetical protein
MTPQLHAVAVVGGISHGLGWGQIQFTAVFTLSSGGIPSINHRRRFNHYFNVITAITFQGDDRFHSVMAP